MESLGGVNQSRRLGRKEGIALIAALLVLSAFTLNWALKGAIHYQKDVIVPDLSGKSLMEALDVLSEHNLGLKKEGSEFNDTVPAGTILRQQPVSGALVREGKIVRITVSQGGETVFVPELVGQTLRSAEITLRTNFLSLGEIATRPSLKYEKDVVVSQDPDPKKIVSKNALVHVTISNGPPEDGQVLMPEFVNRPWEDAARWAEQSGMKAEASKDPNSPLPAGTVAQQSVPADAPLSGGQEIQFTVSAGGGGGAPAVHSAAGRTFRFEVPQGESAREFSFMLVDSFGSREIWRGELEPGTKHEIPLTGRIGPNARIRIYVSGVMAEERSLQ